MKINTQCLNCKKKVPVDISSVWNGDRILYHEIENLTKAYAFKFEHSCNNNMIGFLRPVGIIKT